MHQIKSWLKLMFTYPSLELKVVDYDDYWRDKRGVGIGKLSDWQKDRADFVVDKLSREKDISICDIACGDGSILNYLSNKLMISKMIGTDISQFALKRAEESGIETVLLDIGVLENLELIPESDYHLLFEILEHVPHSEKLLEAVCNKSSRGVFFSFPNTGFFVYRLRLLFGRFPVQWRLSPAEHVRFWTLRDLRWWLRSLGYENYEIYCYKGVPILNKIYPSLFSAAFVVYVPSIVHNH